MLLLLLLLWCVVVEVVGIVTVNANEFNATKDFFFTLGYSFVRAAYKAEFDMFSTTMNCNGIATMKCDQNGSVTDM